MANAWDVTDSTLVEQLNAWLAFISSNPDWSVNLYKNDYTPVPGSVIGDYTPADFAGYAPIEFDPADFDAAFIADHVAIAEFPNVFEFERDGSAGSGQTIYGYYVTDNNGVYRWGERFEQERVIMPFDRLSITLRFRHGVAQE